jgi:hypothetical protein
MIKIQYQLAHPGQIFIYTESLIKKTVSDETKTCNKKREMGKKRTPSVREQRL